MGLQIWGARFFLSVIYPRGQRGALKVCTSLQYCKSFAGSNPAITTGSTVFSWRYRLMVRTLVFETSNPGSIPGNAYFFY